MKGKKWTAHQIDVLEKYWGVASRQEVANRCKKSVAACKAMAYRLGIGQVRENFNGFNVAQLSEVIGVKTTTIHNIWIKKNGLKSRQIGAYKVISEKDLIKFMENHQHLWDARKCDYYYFYTQQWFLDKLERERNQGFAETKIRHWTEYEEQRLRVLRMRGKSYSEIAKELGRTKQSVSKKWEKLREVG